MKIIIKFVLFTLISFVSIFSFSTPAHAAATDCVQTASDGQFDCAGATDRWVDSWGNQAKTYELLVPYSTGLYCINYPAGYACVQKTFTGTWDGYGCSPSDCPKLSEKNINNKTGILIVATHPIRKPGAGENYNVVGSVANHQFFCPKNFTAVYPDPNYGDAICKPPVRTIDLGCPDGSCYKNNAQGINKVGDPVNANSGNKYEIVTDYIYKSSYPLTLTRFYNNKTVSWRTEYDRQLSYIQTTQGEFITLSRPSGESWIFKKVNNVWTSLRANNTLNLNIVNSNKIEVKNDTNEIETYETASPVTVLNSTARFLLTKINKQGGIYTLSYDINGFLKTVTNPFNNVLNFSVSDTISGCNNNPVVTSFTGPGNLTTSYQYNSGCQISRVTYPDNSYKEYTYNGYNLNEETDELGNIIQKNTYNTFSSRPNGYSNTSNGRGATGAIEKVSLNYPSATTTTLTDARGNVVTMSVAQTNGITQTTAFNTLCTFCSGLQGSSITYNANGFVDTVTDFKNNITKYIWDTERNLPLSITEAYGQANARTNTMTWNNTWKLPTTVTTPVQGGNKITTFTYDNNGNILTMSIEAPLNDGSGQNQTRIWQYTYDTLGQLIEIKNPKYTTTFNDKLTIDYQNGQMSSITNGLNQTTTFSDFNEYGQPKTITLPDNTKIILVYDLRGRTLSMTKKNANNTQSYTSVMTYNAAGLVTQLTYPAGNYIKPYYDVTQRLSYVEEYDESSTYLGKAVYTLDDMSNVTKIQILNASGAEIRVKDYQYNNKNLLFKDIASLNQTNTLTYDNNGNLQQITDANNKNTVYGYDSLNRLTTQTAQDNGITTFSYNPDNTISNIQDPKGLNTQYFYNGFGEMIKNVSPDTGTTLYERDLNGNMTKAIDGKNQVQNYEYDILSRVRNINYPQDTTKDITLTYDCSINAVGKLCQIQDYSGTTVYSYDNFGRITGKTFTSGAFFKSMGYAYDSFGRLNKMIYPSGMELNYGYLNNKPITLSYTIGGTTTNIINATTYETLNSSLSSYTLNNGTIYQRLFDKDGLITNTGTSPAIYPINKTLAYDSRFNLKDLTDTNAAKSSTATYDNNSRIISYGFGTTNSYGYSYNTTGDRISKTYNSTSETYTYPSLSHQLTSAGTKNFTYDNNGSTTSESSKSWTYDVTGRMSTFSSLLNNATYKFNGLGQRVYKNINGSEITWFIYNESNKLVAEYDNNNNLKVEYIYFNGQLVALKNSFGIYYVFNDHLGTPRAITDTSNNVQWQWENIEPFGENQPSKINTGFMDFNFRLPGQYFDKESGINHNYFRDYNSSIGRYIQSDPIGLNGGINTYEYVNSNSLVNYDIYGLDCKTFGLIVKCQVPGGPNISFPKPEGWPDSINSTNSFYHYYNKKKYVLNQNIICIENYLRNNPTPNKKPNAATSFGSFNNATPSKLGGIPIKLPMDNDVMSYVMNDGNTQVVVNVTMPSHKLYPGYVARTVTKTANGLVINNFGEGVGYFQSKYFPFFKDYYINDVWYEQSANASDACNC